MAGLCAAELPPPPDRRPSVGSNEARDDRGDFVRPPGFPMSQSDEWERPVAVDGVPPVHTLGTMICWAGIARLAKVAERLEHHEEVRSLDV